MLFISALSSRDLSHFSSPRNRTEPSQRDHGQIDSHLPLQLDDLAYAIVSVLSLRCDKLLALIGIAVEESTVHLALLILQRDVAVQDEAVLQTLGHVLITRAMIQH